MHEIKKINRNFKTGEIYEQKVLKPNQISRNKVTLSLYENGELVEQAETENAISPYYESIAYGDIANRISTNKNISSFPDNDMKFNSILLSNSQSNELENPYFIDGDIIGMCNRLDSSGAGTHELRGTYNAMESYDEITEDNMKHIHLVYDWGTSSGNGTINNIYWLPSNIEWSSGSSSKNIFSYCRTNSSHISMTFDRKGNLYFVNDNKNYKILNVTEVIAGVKDAVTEETETIIHDTEIGDYYYNFEYISSGSGTSYTAKLKITKFNLADEEIETWNEDLIVGISEFEAAVSEGKVGDYSTHYAVVGYCDIDGNVGLEISFSSSSREQNTYPSISGDVLIPGSSDSATVYAFYNVLNKSWIKRANPWDIWSHKANFAFNKWVKKIGNYNLVKYGILKFNETDIFYSDINSKESMSSSQSYFDTIHPTLPYLCDTDNNVNVLSPILAQAKLASPVVKTSANTMKIQYDFYFKIPLPYMPPDHVWDLYSE